MKLLDRTAGSAILFFAWLFLFSGFTFARAAPVESDRWETHAAERRVGDHLGRRSLRLEGGQAVIKESDFTEGTIKFIASIDERGFIGGVWPWQDALDFDEFYLRPRQIIVDYSNSQDVGNEKLTVPPLKFQPLPTPSATPTQLTGHWEGVVTREGKDWRIWLDLDGQTNALKGTIDVPDYGLYALPLTEIRTEGKEIYLERADSSGKVVFKGVLKNEMFKGQFEGLGLTADFQLSRTQAEPVTFVEEEIRFQNGEANLVGTLVKPKKSGKYPVIIFTHGSGNQTRTEEFYRSRAYLFARNGIAALIYDRRGKGDSTGGENNVSFENLADDAIAAVRYLKNRNDINAKQIGISGFSQGGYVSPLAAVRSKDIRFVIVGSAPGITPDEQNDFNVENTLRVKQVSEDKISTVMNLRKRLREYQFSGKGDKSELETEIEKLRGESWFRNTLLPEAEIKLYSQGEKDFLSFDPVPVWEKVSVPVLSVWGEMDLLVPAKKSRDIFENALRKEGNKDFTLKIFPKSGHGLGVVQSKDEPWDWMRLAPGYHDLMVRWLQQRVGEKSVNSPQTEISETNNCDGEEYRQFDFWIGEWKIKQKILKANGKWFESDAETSVKSALDGCALIENWSGDVLFFWEGMNTPEAMKGLSVRSYNPKTKMWSINWMDTRGLALTESLGNFKDGKGAFFRTFRNSEGEETTTRTIFSDITKSAVHWDLAVSSDERKTWRTLWIMEMSRK